MSNYIDPENKYPFTHPDELKVVLNGYVGPDPYRIFTFDTIDRLNEYYENDKFPFSDVEGKNAAPGWSFLVRVNETYKGVAGRLILFFAADTGIESSSQPGQNISFLQEIPIKDPYAANPTASYQDGGVFDYVELDPTTIPAATLAFYGVIRENDKNPNQTEPDTADVSLAAAAEKSAAPAKDDTDAKAAATKAATDTSDTSNPVGAATAQTNTDLAADPTVEDTIRNAPESDPVVAAQTADEYAALQTELSTNPPITRVAEITDRLAEISTSLPPSAASAQATITNAVTPLQNPGNVPGLESLVSQATATAGSFVPDITSAVSNATDLLDFSEGLGLGQLANLQQTLQSGLTQASGLLSGGNLLDNLPDVNELFKFDPEALIKNIDLGSVVNSISSVNFQDIIDDAGGNLTDVVDALAGAFGPIGRSFGNNPALADLIGSDTGFGNNTTPSTTAGEQVQRTVIATPEDPAGGPAPASTTPYEKLIEVLEKSLSQDWAVKSGEGDGIPPSELEESRDPRGKDQIPPVPPNTNPLIMEAYRISGQPGLTKDGTTGEYAWHTAFVNWVLTKAGFTAVGSMSAQAYYTYGNRVNHTNLNNLKARKGDLVIFNSKTGAKHIGFFWGFDKDARTVQILGGNQAGTVKLSDFPFSLKDGDFYVTHIRRNWEVPAEVEAAGPEGELTSRLDGKDGDLTTPNESAIGPTGAPADEISLDNVTGIAPDPLDRDRDGLPDRATRFGLEDVTMIAPDPDLARVTFEDDGTATLPRDATPAESAAAKEELNKRARRKSDDAFFNPGELSDEEYDAIEVPKRLTPEERKARDAAAREKRKSAADRRKAQQAKDNEFYGGGAFSTSGGNTNRVVTTTQSTKTTTTGGGSTSYKSPPTKDDNGASAIKAAKGSFYRSLSSAQRKAASLKSKYGVTVTPYQPSGSKKWRLR